MTLLNADIRKRWFVIMVCCMLSIQHAHSLYAQSAKSLLHQLGESDPALQRWLRPITEFQTISYQDSLSFVMDLIKSNEVIWIYPDSARTILQRSLNSALQKGIYDQAATCTINLGLVLLGEGDFEESRKTFVSSIPYIKKSRAKATLSTTLLINTGASYYYQEDYQKAFEYYYSTLQFVQKEGSDWFNRAMAYNNIADALIRMKQKEKASYYLNLAKSLITDSVRESVVAGYFYINESEIALLSQKYDSVALLLDKVAYNFKNLPNPDLEQMWLVMKARYLIALGKPEQGIPYLTKAVSSNINAYPYFATVYPRYILGQAYYSVNDYVNAEKILSNALNTAEKAGILSEKLPALKTLADIYSRTERPVAAYNTLRSYVQLQDSITNLEHIRIASEMEARFRTAEKDRKIKEDELLIQLQKKDLRNKNTLILLSAAVVLLIIISVYVYFRYMVNKERMVSLKAKAEGEELERKRIASELHDGIGGMLAALKMKISSGPGNTREVVDLLDEIAEQVRHTAHNLMPGVLKHSSLAEALKLYISDLNSNNRAPYFNIQVNTKNDVKDENKSLNLYRIVQEVIQNIIKHAGASQVDIQLFESNGKLHLLIEDDGRGFDTTLQVQGMGLKGIQARVQFLKGSFLIDSSPNEGTTINIQIPV